MENVNFLKVQVDDWEYFREGQEKINFVLNKDNKVMLSMYKEILNSTENLKSFIRDNEKLYCMNRHIFGSKLHVTKKESYCVSIEYARRLIEKANCSRPKNRIEEFPTFPRFPSKTDNGCICCFITENINNSVSWDELDWVIEIKPKGGLSTDGCGLCLCGYCNKVQSKSKYCSNLFYSRDKRIRTDSIFNLITENTSRVKVIKPYKKYTERYIAKQISDQLSKHNILQTIFYLQNYNNLISLTKREKDKEIDMSWNSFIENLQNKLLNISNLYTICVSKDKCNVLSRGRYKNYTNKSLENNIERFAFNISKIYKDISFIFLKDNIKEVKIYLLDIELKPLYKQPKLTKY